MQTLANGPLSSATSTLAYALDSNKCVQFCGETDGRLQFCLQGVLIHDANPYFDAFGAYMGPLLDQPVDVRRFNELNASKHVPCRLDGM